MTQEINNNMKNNGEEMFSLRNIFSMCLANWYWIAGCVVIALAVAVLYVKSAQPVYTRSSSLIIKQDARGRSISSETDKFAEMGLFRNNTNVNNEIYVLKSPMLMSEVVKSLNLTTNYTTKSGLRKKVLYGTERPFNVHFESLSDNESAALMVRMINDSLFVLYDFKKGVF